MKTSSEPQIVELIMLLFLYRFHIDTKYIKLFVNAFYVHVCNAPSFLFTLLCGDLNIL